MAKKIADIWIDKQSVRASLIEAQQAVQGIYEHMVNTMQYVGEACITEARRNGAYQDITGNLRSSIGYIVLNDGQAVANSKDAIVKNGKEGAAEAQKLLQQLSKDFPKGIVLIVCAGMNYASYVEELRGRNVLSSANIKAETLVPKLLNDLVRQIQRNGN